MKIGLLGLGTVGSGVYEIINHQKGHYFATSKEEAIITKVMVRDINKIRNINIPDKLLVTNFEEIVNDDEIQVVICVMGGIELEYSCMIQAMNNGKHVITANKAVVSEYMDILYKTAKQNNVSFLYEASVGGGIPIITSLIQTLRINQIDEIKGILNGTTNFILSKMTDEGWNFADTLKKAQDMGFAEADPTADIDGSDVSRKLSILSSMAFGSHIKDENIYKRGIKEISEADIDMFNDLGYVLKYLAHSKLEGNKYYATVEPVLLTNKNIMSNVNEEFNIVSLNGNIIGELQFYGKGAGKNATANAVVGDLLYIINNDFKKQEITLEQQLENGGNIAFEGKYYLRVDTNDHDQFTKVIDLVDEFSKKKKITFNSSKIYVLTEEIKANIFNKLVDKINAIGVNSFYARIYS
ncbi:homoserine dehydrogenase [Alkalibaculum sp. M08DMB]|uniref:Homoserine dehydrogenase n=1 Tax=Alkalibaculum sporogenes TaxID=2655001 RepID=A0A6A7KD32_9FIRM|nr:homoserine dehydrogenase [Alkalibaculum sporogenes]MPW26913.1 homoserine dehydrogenase [Alkalibaculum sporogenes]